MSEEGRLQPSSPGDANQQAWFDERENFVLVWFVLFFENITSIFGQCIPPAFWMWAVSENQAKSWSRDRAKSQIFKLLSFWFV